MLSKVTACISRVKIKIFCGLIHANLRIYLRHICVYKSQVLIGSIRSWFRHSYLKISNFPWECIEIWDQHLSQLQLLNLTQNCIIYNLQINFSFSLVFEEEELWLQSIFYILKFIRLIWPVLPITSFFFKLENTSFKTTVMVFR